jgi:hypothetical protein
MKTTMVLFTFLDVDAETDRERFRAYFVDDCVYACNAVMAALMDTCDGGCDRDDGLHEHMERLFDMLEVGRDEGWVHGGDRDGPKVLVPRGMVVSRVVTVTGIAEPISARMANLRV